MAPVNTNYRYGPDEIIYLFDNADAEAVVFHACFTELVEGIRDRLPKVRRWYVVADETGTGPAWAIAVRAGGRRRVARRTIVVVAAAATTCCCCTPAAPPACPRASCGARTTCSTCSAPAAARCSASRRPPASTRWSSASIRPSSAAASCSSACPLMHGTGQFSALITMSIGGAVVTLAEPQVRRRRAVRARVEREGVTNIVIVGQAFAGPMLDALDEHPGRYDLSSVRSCRSSGVMWSQENKAGPARPHPADDALRLVRLVRGGRPRRLGVGRRRGREDREVHARPEQRRVHRRRPPGRAGLGRAGHGGRQRLHPARLLQGRGEDGVDVPHVSRAGGGASPATGPR